MTHIPSSMQDQSLMINSRRLWLKPEDLTNCPQDAQQSEYNDDTYRTIFDRFSSRPEPKSLSFLLSNTLVVGQEFVLTCLLLAGHRATLLEEDFHRLNKNLSFNGIHSDRLLTSLGLVWLTLVVAVALNRFATSKQYTVRHRLTDFLLMAVLLRFLSAVLKTLTASYSSDTVYALSIASLLLHLLACDYAYANGYRGDEEHDNEKDDAATAVEDDKHKRPTFKGGLLSLSSAFFATTLLASRLESNAAVYVFVCCSVVLFALYPAARHLIALKSQEEHRWVPFLITGILTLALVALLEQVEVYLVLMITSMLCLFVPLWKFQIQKFKITLRGPWDIAHV